MQSALPEIVIYARSGCAYCTVARLLLDRRNLPYRELDIRTDPAAADEMRRRTGGALTVPQIMIGDRAIGGLDALLDLDGSGRLDAMLGG